MEKHKSHFSASIKIFLFLSTFICSYSFAQTTCKVKHVVKNAKSNIKPPYKYDSYAMTEFVIDPKREKRVLVNFTAFEDMKYQITFFNSGVEENISVNIYDKSAAVKTRKKIYDSSQGIDNDFWIFEAVKPGRYYIEYVIPKSADGIKKTGCIVMLIGYTDVD